jgi:hypothetical protein
MPTQGTAAHNTAQRDTMPYWLASLGADELAGLMTRRPDVLVHAPSTLVELADRLSAPESVRLVIHGLDRTRVDVLAAAQTVAGDPTVDTIIDRFRPRADRAVVEGVLGELCRLGVMWPVGGAFRLVRPFLGVDPHLHGRAPLHVEPPAPRLAPVDVDIIDQAAGAAALPTVLGMARLIELCSVTPLEVLRSGGVGVKEIRRTAKALSADESMVRLWLALAYHADLVDNDDGAIMPTAGADEWLARTPAQRLVPLLMTWWRLPAAPTAPDAHGKPPTALLHAYHDMDRQMRHDLVEWFADQPPGVALADRRALLALLAWRKPYAYGEADTSTDVVGAITAEAESLGVLAYGGLSTWGRALVSGREDELADAVERALPQATGSVRLQADLTAVVTGIPTAELGDLLDLAADAGERDTASVWRFSPGSVRRALDAGWTAERLLADLGDVSTHALPQPLVYLVRDVERRHGELTVAAVGCCVLADDRALLTEIAAHRGLVALAPRVLAPGVLGSALPVPETLALLRKHGYAPVQVDGAGAPKLERVAPLRARNRPRATSSWAAQRVAAVLPAVDDLRSLAEELLAERVVEPEVPMSGPAAAVHQHGDHLSNRELALLTDALGAEKPVEITYLDQNDRHSRRVITPLDQIGGILDAWCHLRDDERHFLISRIQRVDAVTSV